MGVKADALVVQQKKSTGFCSMSSMANLLRFFPAIDLYFYKLASIVGKYIIDSFLRAQSRQRKKLNVYVFQLAKNGTFVGLLRFSSSILFACAASNRVNLEFKATIIEDTHLTLAGISSKVEANNL